VGLVSRLTRQYEIEDRVANFPTEDNWVPGAWVEGFLPAEFVRPGRRPLDRAGERIPTQESRGYICKPSGLSAEEVGRVTRRNYGDGKFEKGDADVFTAISD